MDIRRFLAELKGRGVYRVAAIYAAGSWAFLQVADIFFPILGFPDWAITSVLAVAALGFPVAIILAWVFEVTPEGIVEIDPEVNFGKLKLSPARLAELGLLLALIFLVGFLYLERLTLQEKVAEAFADDQDQRPSVAVMAFENMSDDPTAEYFGDGLAEEILNMLSRISELDVAARTSSFYFKGKEIDLREVGSKLGVEHVLEGSVRRSGDRVRITAQLIEMDTGYHVWSETFDRDYSDSFQIQDEIARQVVGSMQVILSDSSKNILNARTSVDPQAYDYYLKGREYLRSSLGGEDSQRAIVLFQKAISLDPDYAEAYAGLCDAHLNLYRNDLDPEDFKRAKQACDEAISLDTTVLPVYVALGNLHRLSGEYATSEGQLKKALAINPRYVPALKALALTLYADDHPQAAEETLFEAISLQPGNWDNYLRMGNMMFDSGRFADAIRYYRRITELVPDHAGALNNLGAAHFMLNQFDDAADVWTRSLALEPSAAAYSNAASSLFFSGRYREAVDMYHKAVELAPENFENWGNLGDAYRYTEDMKDLAGPMYRNAIKLASAHLEINPSDALTIALVAHYYAAVGEREEALQYHARAIALAPDNVFVYYNSAILLSTLGEQDRALEALTRAMALGYPTALIYADAGLAQVRTDKKFEDAVAAVSNVPESEEEVAQP